LGFHRVASTDKYSGIRGCVSSSSAGSNQKAKDAQLVSKYTYDLAEQDVRGYSFGGNYLRHIKRKSGIICY
jgi:hypothetical protein